MKIIHCADLHLDSKMSANLDKTRARERNSELLTTFQRMIAYAGEHKINAILISGDLFDTRKISATAKNTVYQAIISHPRIHFFYLKGNHDQENVFATYERIPENLHMFDRQWKSYRLGNITINGVELTSGNVNSIYNTLLLDTKYFNIVMLHGQESTTAGNEKNEIINLKLLKNKGIDYLALGHVHAYKKEQLDARGIYCYPGCLEGRGFDECGEHGFIVMEIDETTGQYKHEFIPFASRVIYTISVDITGCITTPDIATRIRIELAKLKCPKTSLLKLVLTGMVEVECEKNIDYLVSNFKAEYYFVKIYDETKLQINYQDYALDESLKGEFVRTVMNDTKLSEEDKIIIIRYGLQSIAGEEIQ